MSKVSINVNFSENNGAVTLILSPLEEIDTEAEQQSVLLLVPPGDYIAHVAGRELQPIQVAGEQLLNHLMRHPGGAARLQQTFTW